ncbi:integration host factor subunit alpha [Oryzomonas rubra]|uniref:Integration host factor subunit alpha n=1 Tax=Oryzomonas rubra TaxID=2509454 RepID=A0A5A9X655_9BACT|nr:integration host factor subunit alpha [Oryzomonas rubra]KAA0888133.1 integration host factor subunit alpha [Oryzomonas rubra]
MSLTKAELAQTLHAHLGLHKSQATELLEETMAIIKASLESGEDVKIAGFGKFEVKQKNARKGRNPQTGESLTIDGRRIVTFKPSAILRDKINGGRQ